MAVADSHQNQILVRINGVLPSPRALGDEGRSERAAEVMRSGKFASTSCSIIKTSKENGSERTLHILVDPAAGAFESVKNGLSEIGITKASPIPDVILVTNTRDDRIKDLLAIVAEATSLSSKLKVICTKECIDKILAMHPELANNQVLSLEPAEPSKENIIGAFSITPIAVQNGGEEVPAEQGSVIYMVKIDNVKIITAWDFISLLNPDSNLMWNPDLLVIGAETYNDHPSTGSISVTEAYGLITKWNATNALLVHYGGLKDFEDAKNQWFRGPVKAMTTSELQKAINSVLQIAGQEGRFKITVAKEGMIWRPETYDRQDDEKIGNIIEITSIQKYLLRFEKVEKKLNLMVEDNINRLSLEFVNPRTIGNGEALQADSTRSMFMKGPELKMEIVPASRESAHLKVRITQGRKTIMNEDIQIMPKDATRLIKYFSQNFGPSN
jgi:hypothetical protein